MNQLVQLQWTCDDEEVVKEVIEDLLGRKLVACINYFPVRSSYLDGGEIHHAEEFKVHMKLKEENWERVECRIRELATYEVSEILAFSVDKVSEPYLTWVVKET